jgi:hypothetical protein
MVRVVLIKKRKNSFVYFDNFEQDYMEYMVNIDLEELKNENSLLEEETFYNYFYEKI